MTGGGLVGTRNTPGIGIAADVVVVMLVGYATHNKDLFRQKMWLELELRVQQDK